MTKANIHNSTVDFLVFTKDAGENSVCAKMAQTADDGRAYGKRLYISTGITGE